MDTVPESAHYNAHSTDTGYRIVALIVQGHSLQSIAALPGMPTADVIAWWAAGTFQEGAAGVVAKHYAHARVAQGELLAGQAVRMVRELASGLVEGTDEELSETAFKRFRVALDSLRWMLPKMARATWGDELHVKHSGTVSLEQIARQQEQRGGGVLGTARARVFDGRTGEQVFEDDRDEQSDPRLS